MKSRFICILTMILSGCSDPELFHPNETAKNLSEAGSFHLAVLSVVPWNDFKNQLKPNFQLTGSEALNQVLPVTQSIEEKLLDALFVGLQLGLPSTTFSSTQNATRQIDRLQEATAGTTIDSAGNVVPSATTSDKTTVTDQDKTTDSTTRASGTLPPLSEKDPAAGRKISDLPGLASRMTDQDPMLEYQAATALLQEVALLNSYVDNAAILTQSIPYIVRMQLSAMPVMRDQPLDLYADLAFLPGLGEGNDDLKAVKAPHVVPLLVTDNINATQRSRAVGVIRQFGLAIGGAAQGITAQGQLNKLSDDLKSVIGEDLNSLFTVARLGDSTIRVRMGAPAQPNAGYAMIPRTHNLTALVMIPRGHFVGENKQNKELVEVNIVGSYDLRNGSTGKRLPGTNPETRDNLAKTFQWAQCKKLDVSSERGTLENNMMEAVVFSNWEKFVQASQAAGCPSGIRQFLWLELMKLTQTEGYVSAFFEVRAPKSKPATVLPGRQIVTLLDDGRTTSVTQLFGGEGAPEAARLEVGGRSLPAIEIERAASELRLTFPSLKSWGLERAGGSSRIRLICSRCYVETISTLPGCGDVPMPNREPASVSDEIAASDGAACYPASVISKSAPSLSQALDVGLGASRLVVVDGAAELPVFVKMPDQNLVDIVTLRVAGASLMNAEPSVVNAAGEVRVATDAVVNMRLKNVIPTVPVTVIATGFKGDVKVAERKLQITVADRPMRRSASEQAY
jgi:hypothetical protein